MKSSLTEIFAGALSGSAKKRLCAALLAGVLLFAAHHADAAETIADYRQNIKAAQSSINEFSGYLLDVEDDITERDAAYERELISAVKNRLPPTETVEFQGTTVQTGNEWLNEKLDRLGSADVKPEDRDDLAAEISERLSSLDQKLAELETPGAAAQRSKDEDKQKLAEILKRQEFQKPEDEKPSLFEKWTKAVVKWIEDLFPKSELPQPTDSAGFKSLSVVLQIALYAAVFGIIGFLLYKFLPVLFDRVRGRQKSEKKERVILGEKIAAHESPDSIFDEAEALAREGNLRGAIRKGYIALLCELADRKVIGLAQHKTNRDYLRDVRQTGSLYDNMRDLTGNFERHWYGFEPATETDWEKFRRDYRKTTENR